jgi:RES domain-containing protein
LLEYFVHLDMEDPPSDLVLAIAEAPDDLSRERIEIDNLPSKWRSPAALPQLAGIGNEFVRKAENCLLLAPSALAPNEYNWLINPAHPDFRRINILELEPLAYDPRMFGKTGR